MIVVPSLAIRERVLALSDAIPILVINFDAFAKDSSEANGDTAEKAKKKGKSSDINPDMMCHTVQRVLPTLSEQLPEQ